MNSLTPFSYQIEFVNKLEDTEAGLKLVLRKYHPNYKIIYYTGLALSLMPLLLVILTGSDHPIVWYCVTFVSFAYFLMLILHIPFKLRIKINPTNYGINQTHIIRFDNDSISFKINNDERIFFWNSIIYILNDEKYILISSPQNSMILIPRHAFRTQSEYLECVNHINLVWHSTRADDLAPENYGGDE